MADMKHHAFIEQLYLLHFAFFPGGGKIGTIRPRYAPPPEMFAKFMFEKLAGAQVRVGDWEKGKAMENGRPKRRNKDGAGRGETVVRSRSRWLSIPRNYCRSLRNSRRIGCKSRHMAAINFSQISLASTRDLRSRFTVICLPSCHKQAIRDTDDTTAAQLSCKGVTSGKYKHITMVMALRKTQAAKVEGTPHQWIRNVFVEIKLVSLNVQVILTGLGSRRSEWKCEDQANNNNNIFSF